MQVKKNILGLRFYFIFLYLGFQNKNTLQVGMIKTHLLKIPRKFGVNRSIKTSDIMASILMDGTVKVVITPVILITFTGKNKSLNIGEK